MVTLRSRARTLETPSNPKHSPSNPKHSHDGNPLKVNKNEDASGYEQSRDERIKQNLQRMQKLGIFDLSHKLKSNISPKKIRRINPDKNSPLNPSLPTRRSSRLQGVTPVSYYEVRESKKGKELGSKEISIREGLQPEIYSEEHEKLLGTCEENWVLFVDGYGADGKRIYDPLNGKTCHQCRQKTLGHRTHCSNCNLVQGQFCGDCLYMRYGENVLEAEKNPDWICPVCRGICNCSLCRQKSGWAPTGMLYKKVVSHGYKSVAHYLIQTRRSQENTDDPVSAKRSLPFTDAEETSPQKGSLELDGDECHRCVDPEESKANSNNEFNWEKEQQSSDKKDVNSKFTAETKPSMDCIAGRLRKRRNSS